MKKNDSFKPFCITATIIFLVWLATGTIIFLSLDSWAIRGQFGDMFGAINALFSGLAFAGVIFTIMLQRRELSYQRRELALTRHELKRSAGAQENQYRIAALSTLVQSYGLILNPQAGLKNRQILEHDLNEDRIKAKFISALDDLESSFVSDENGN